MGFKELNKFCLSIFEESLTPDLLQSKIWLCNNLKTAKQGERKGQLAHWLAPI
jgi:hypothetical protein